MNEHHNHDALSCREIFSLLSDYIDGELPADTCQEVEEHIHDCAPCVEFMESLKTSVALVRGHEPAVAPGQIPPALREALLKVYRQKLESRGQNAH
jgi:anti-sigma factor RsiW